MDCFIGLDIGTSAVKGAVLSESGKILHLESEKFTYFGENGKRLLDPDEYCEICFSVIKKLADFVKDEYKVAAICSCCASGNLLLLDKTNKPLTPIIGWQTHVDHSVFDGILADDYISSVYETAGWPLGNGMTPAWLCAIKKQHPDILEKAQAVVMSAEYMNFKLTGKWGLAHSMATPFFLVDQAKGEYNIVMLEKLGITDKFLPPIYSKGTVLGKVKPELAEKLHISSDTQVVLGSFDPPSGALGSGVFDEGEMLLSCGTSWVEFFPVPSREFAVSTKGLVDRYMIGSSPYCVMKSLASVSVKIDRIRKLYFGNITHQEFDVLLKQSKPGCDGLRFTLEETDTFAKGNYSDGQIARAIIESAALQLKENLENLKKCGLRAEKITAIGGITNSDECVKVISKTLGSEIKVVNGQSAGAVGSCLLAGIGVGTFENEKAAFAKMKVANEIL